MHWKSDFFMIDSWLSKICFRIRSRMCTFCHLKHSMLPPNFKTLCLPSTYKTAVFRGRSYMEELVPFHYSWFFLCNPSFKHFPILTGKQVLEPLLRKKGTERSCFRSVGKRVLNTVWFANWKQTMRTEIPFASAYIDLPTLQLQYCTS